MKACSAELAAALQQGCLTTATCWKITRKDAVVMGFTSHDKDIIYGGVTYKAASAYTPSAIASSNQLTVDNLEVEGILSSSAITEEALQNGTYDFALVEVFLLDYLHTEWGVVKLRVGRLGQVRTNRDAFFAEIRGIADAFSHQVGEVYSPGCRVKEFGDSRCKMVLAQTSTLLPTADLAGYTSSWKSYPASPTSLWDKVDDAADDDTTYITANFGSTAAGPYAKFDIDGFSFPTAGLPTAGLTLTVRARKVGSGTATIYGFICVDSTIYYTDLYTLTESWVSYNKTWDLNPKTSAAWTGGQLNGLATSNRITNWGIKAVTGSVSTPIRVTTCRLQCPYTLTRTGAVTTVVDRRTFKDSSRSEAADFFKYGKLTWTAGDNNGLSAEVKEFSGSPRTFELQIPMLRNIQVGDTYSVIVGCDRSRDTCKGNFNNVINFRGEPDLPMRDRMVYGLGSEPWPSEVEPET